MTGRAEPGGGRDVVVLRGLGLGDLLTAVPALRALRRAYPGRRLVLAAPAWLAPLLPVVSAVDDLAPTEGPVTPPWSGSPPEIAVNLHGRGPQSIRALRALRPRRLWSFRHPACPETVGPSWRPGEHEVARWCRLVSWHGLHADPADLGLAPPPARSPAPDAAVLHPGGARAARRWPAERFAAVGRHLRGRGLRVVVTGTGRERDLARRVAVAAGIPAGDALAGRTSLPELAALVAGARLVVCADTGVGHLATGYGTPSVVVFGPVPPGEWGPPPGRTRHRALWTGRRGDPDAVTTDPGLLRITAADVTAAADALLAGAPV